MSDQTTTPRGGQRSTIIVSGYDVYGEPMEETIRDVYTGPDFYFWLGADAYPEWPVVTSIEIRR